MYTMLFVEEDLIKTAVQKTYCQEGVTWVMGHVPRNAASNLELILASFLLLLKEEEVGKNAFEAEARGIHPGLNEFRE